MMTAHEITCPGCGTVSHFQQLQRSAQEFCRRCDYPLFWVRSSDEPVAEAASGDTGLRRLPGAGGHQTVASLGCPECNEPNAYTATVCIRCGSDLRPVAPPPVPTVAAEPAEPPPPPRVEEPIPAIWPQLVLLIGVPILVVLALLTVLD